MIRIQHCQCLLAGLFCVTLLTAAPQQGAAAQESQPQTHGLPPRATPGDYQAHGQAGTVTIGAEFAGHSVPTPEQVLSNENFVTVEVGFYGPPGAKLMLSHDDFSLRINGKKVTTPEVQYGAIFKALKDPEYVPPEAAGAAKASKGGLSTGGGQSDVNSPPPVIHIPIGVERKMEQHVQKASLPEGDRPLPEAGLIYFEYGGKVNGIRSMELIYSGAAGKVVIPLQ